MVDISTPHCVCPSKDVRLSLRPALPMARPAMGRSMNTNMVSCHDMATIMVRHTMIITGFLKNMSSDDIMENSISATSPLIRAMTSPLRSEVKNPMGSTVTLSNI